jgi:hypothetical protein
MLPKRQGKYKYGGKPKYRHGGPGPHPNPLTKISGLGNAADIIKQFTGNNVQEYLRGLPSALGQGSAVELTDGDNYSPSFGSMGYMEPVENPNAAATYDMNPASSINYTDTVPLPGSDNSQEAIASNMQKVSVPTPGKEKFDLLGGIGSFVDNMGGNLAALGVFNANRRDIDKMPIRQNYTTTRASMEDVTDRSGAAVNEARRQARATRLLGAQSGVNAARQGNLNAVASAGAANQIGQIKNQENLRQDQVRARNVERGNRANQINTGIYNQMEGDAISNEYLQQQNRINNRNALTQSILGNDFQRRNRDLQEDALRLTAALDAGRGTVAGGLGNIDFNDPFLSTVINSQRGKAYGGPINYKTNY